LRVAVLTLLAAWWPAHADAAEELTRRLEEVVVTAQRREEVAQSTPVSLVALDRETLDTLGILSIDDIGAHVPNFTADQFPANNQTLRLFIRGVGITDVQITQDPAVGVYLDGVYLARSTGLATEVADLERIEVLRGPQGTLFGRNTTGGALNLVSRRPNRESVEFQQVLGVGDQDRRYIKSMLNLPITENHAVKISALKLEEEGFVRNTGPGGDYGDREALALRLDWRWHLSERLTLDYSWDSSRVESYNYSPQGVIPGTLSGAVTDPATQSSVRFVPFSDQRIESLATSVPLLPSDTQIEGHALTLEWELAQGTLKFISAWRELDDRNYIDFSAGASSEYRIDYNSVTLGANSPNQLRTSAARTPLWQEQYSQELQYLGEWNAQLEYVAGLYYFEEEALEDDLPVHHIFSFPLLQANDLLDVVNFRGERNAIENKALAAYGQATWTPGWMDSRIHLSLGWRTSRDERSVSRIFKQHSFIDAGTSYIGPLEVIDFSATAKRDFRDNSFTFMAEFDWTDTLVSYAKFVEAYKSGGFNTRDPDPEYFSRGFDDEHNQTVEIGFKGELADRRLRLNSAVFYSEFEDLQLNFLLPNTISDTRVLNSGAAKISGFELELAGYLYYGLLGRLDYAYLDSSIEPVINPFTGELREFTFPNSPRHSASISFDYQMPMTVLGRPVMNLNYNYLSDREGQNVNMDRGAYRLLNGRISLTDIPLVSEQLSLSVWVKNALDEEYVAFALDNLPHADRAVLWGEPRRIGLDIQYRFGN